jgi:glycosyltransferase involved in cell wall biosynthesis
MTRDSRPLVSIIIPCSNQAQSLPDAVRTAAARTARVQIVVVDDGSTDGTAAAASRLDVILVRQPKLGLAAARNRGLQVSTGAFVIFLDADDRLVDGAIDAGVRALVSRPDCAMAYGRCMMAGPDGELWPTPESPIVRTGHHAALLQTNLIWMPAMAILRRDAVERAGGFAEGFDGAADYDLYLRISRDAPVIDHGCLVAAYRRHPASMSGQASRMLRDTLEVMRRNRPDATSPFYDAWREGYVRWQDFYGTQLVDEIRAHVREHVFSAAVRKAIVLLSLAPWVSARELGRTAPARHAGRAIRTAKISAARRRVGT